jgi:predicted ArsR family transcriptional regulator
MNIAIVRNSDPISIHQAADMAASLRERHKRLILADLNANGPAGKDRIAARVKLDGVQVCRRLSELERLNLARPTERMERSNSERWERVWEVVAE